MQYINEGVTYSGWSRLYGSSYSYCLVHRWDSKYSEMIPDVLLDTVIFPLSDLQMGVNALYVHMNVKNMQK